MQRLTPTNGKVAVPALVSNTATLLTTQPDHETGCINPTPAHNSGATGAPAMLRLLHLQLDQLGLAHSATEDDRIVIAGRSFDLRGARAYVRLMGGRP
jgi:hypothetical protein